MDHKIDLSMLIQVVSSVQSVVADYYGPQCAQTLMTSSTGKAVISSDGMTILEALQAEHPVARLVFQAIQNCHSVTKDGSKLFLLYLSNILVNIQQEIHQGSFTHGGTNLKLHQKASSLCVRRSLQFFKDEVLPKLREDIISHCCKVRRQLGLDNKQSQRCFIKNILQTAMMPHYSLVQCSFYADLLVEFLPIDNGDTDLIEALNLVVEKFNHIVIKVPNRLYKDCAAFPLFLIKQTFKYKYENLQGNKEFRAVVLHSSCFGSETDEVSDMVKITELSGIEKMVLSMRSVVEKFVKSLVHNRIDIVLSQNTLPNYVVDILRRNQISVVSNVLEDDIELIEIISNKLKVNDFSEDIDEVNVIELSDVYEVIIGGRQYIQFKFNGHLKSLKHLIICAPTVGLCDQLALTLQKALNALKLSFISADELNSHCFSNEESLENKTDLDTAMSSNEDTDCDVIEITKRLKLVADGNHVSEARDTGLKVDYNIWQNVSVIEGGTSFEILLAHLLKTRSVDSADPNLYKLCDIIEKAMFSVVQKLYENTCIEPKNKRNFLKVKTLLTAKVHSDRLWGLDRHGSPCNPMEKGVLEPVLVKFHTLHCVLDLISQLLGIDKIVSCRKINLD